MKCRIEHIPSVSAVYYALLQSGYEFYSVERPPELCRAIETHIVSEQVPSFFLNVRQSTCDVYPFWPRAFILEAATFFLSDDLESFTDFDSFRSQVLSATNISPEEISDALWNWLIGFPAAIKAVVNSVGFQSYLKWESEWISDQNKQYAGALHRLNAILQSCCEKYRPTCQNIRIVLNPIKCLYSSDYHFSGDSFIFTSGDLKMQSVIHEYLHTVVHPMLAQMKTDRRQYPGIDASYYQSGNEQGYRNAFEEYAVRSLTDSILRQEWPSELQAYLDHLTRNPKSE